MITIIIINLFPNSIDLNSFSNQINNDDSKKIYLNFSQET